MRELQGVCLEPLNFRLEEDLGGLIILAMWPLMDLECPLELNLAFKNLLFGKADLGLMVDLEFGPGIKGELVGIKLSRRGKSQPCPLFPITAAFIEEYVFPPLDVPLSLNPE